MGDVLLLGIGLFFKCPKCWVWSVIVGYYHYCYFCGFLFPWVVLFFIAQSNWPVKSAILLLF